MSDAEIWDWIRDQGPTPQKQRATIQNLLRFANRDAMSPADRAICVRALDLLKDTTT